MLFLVAVASCLVCVQSQKVFFGGCPSTTIMPNFDPNQYFGDWYENRKFFAIFEFGQRCIKANYADDGNGNIVVTNSALGIITGSPTSVTGIGGQVSPPSGALGVTFASTTTPPTTANYLVLGTDYSSYSVVWSCNDFGFFNTQFLWILTREREASESVVNAAIAVIDSNNLNKNKLRITDQSNCSN